MRLSHLFLVVPAFSALPAFAADAPRAQEDGNETASRASDNDADDNDADDNADGAGHDDSPLAQPLSASAAESLTPSPQEVIPRPDAFDTPAAETPGSPFISFTADIGVATAYALRGLNAFQSNGQQEVASVCTPAFEVGFGDTGLAVGWLGAAQLNGANREELVSRGIGAENNVFATWSTALGESVEVGAATTVLLYPLADAGAAGTVNPMYVEPAVNVTWTGPVDVGAEVIYSTGVQAAVAGAPYAYLHLTGEKAMDLGGGYGLTAGGGGGYKAYTVPDAPTDNVWDVSLDLTVQRDFDNGIYVAPSVHGAWTNLEGKTVGESMFVWVGMNMGVGI